jgi:Tetratricopeptide repeat
MDDSDPTTAASREDLAACLKRLHLLADEPTYRALELQTTRAGGFLPGTRLKRSRLTRSTLSDVLNGRKFPRKAFLLTFVDACGVDVAADQRWAQAWDRLARQYQQNPASAEDDGLRRENEDLRRQLAAAEDRAAAIADLVENAIPGDCSQPGAWPVCAKLLPLAQAVLADESAGLGRLSEYLGSRVDPAAARDLQQKVFGARVRVLGPEHPSTLAAGARLAYWTGRAGNAGEARDQLARLLPDFERVLGPEHPLTLTAAGNLASLTGEAGNAGEARDLLAGLVPVFERVRGPKHPQTLTARDHLAFWTGEAEDAGEARNQLARLIPDLERVLGPEAPPDPDRQSPPRLLDQGGGRRRGGPGPARRADPRPRAGPGAGAPRDRGGAGPPRLLDRGGGGCDDRTPDRLAQLVSDLERVRRALERALRLSSGPYGWSGGRGASRAPHSARRLGCSMSASGSLPDRDFRLTVSIA